MIALANGFLVAFGVDACLSLLDEAMRAAGAGAILAAPRNVVARLVLLAAPLVYLLTAFSPAIPARLLVPLVVLEVWLCFGAMPLPLCLDAATLRLALPAIQCAAAAVAFVWIRRRSDGTRWLLGPQPAAGGPPFARVLGLLGGAALVAPIAAAVQLLLSVAAWSETATAGFLRLRPSGIFGADRRYRSGDREVRLVGMMHIGEGRAYDEIFDSFAAPGTVVLEEGVTDREGLLHASLSYGGVAETLGLEAQSDVGLHFEERWEELEEDERWPHLRHADVDVSELAPATVFFVETVAEVFGADGPREALRIFSERQREGFDYEQVQADLIGLRNEALVEALDRALVDYDRVVVPWGALHLAGIEQSLRGAGFEKVGDASHAIVWWGPGTAPTLAGESRRGED